MKHTKTTAFLAIFCLQLTIFQCTSVELDNKKVSCKQNYQVSRSFGELDASVSTAREILETTTKRIRHLEEICMKGLPSQVIDADINIPTDSLSIDGDLARKTKVLYRDCAEAIQNGVTESGVYEIEPTFWKYPINVSCDMKTDGGGWTVFQRRLYIYTRENFYRGWDDYKKGFGNLTQEFWLGNDLIFALSNRENMTLRVDLQDYDNNTRFAVYDHFRIRPESENYRLVIGTYSDGNAGDALVSAKNMAFSTKDRKNDIWNEGSCAERFKGAWWYSNCHSANLNGFPYKGNHSTYADGINWQQFKGYHYSLKFTEMKIRPSGFKES